MYAIGVTVSIVFFFVLMFAAIFGLADDDRNALLQKVEWPSPQF